MRRGHASSNRRLACSRCSWRRRLPLPHVRRTCGAALAGHRPHRHRHRHGRHPAGGRAGARARGGTRNNHRREGQVRSARAAVGHLRRGVLAHRLRPCRPAGDGRGRGCDPHGVDAPIGGRAARGPGDGQPERHHRAHLAPANHILDHDKLQDGAGPSLGETINGLAGVHSINEGPAIGKPVIRGLSSTRVLVLDNGQRIETQGWGTSTRPTSRPRTPNGSR